MASKKYHLVKNEEQEGGYVVPVVALRSSPIYGYPVLGEMPTTLRISIGSETLSFDIPQHLARSLVRYIYQVKNMRTTRSFSGIDIVIGSGSVQYREKLTGDEVAIIFSKLADLSEGKKPRLYIDDNLRSMMKKVQGQLEELLVQTKQKTETSAIPL